MVNRGEHRHTCPDCWQPWEHDDERCLRQKISKRCDSCILLTKHKEAFFEMARNMPIPHYHICVIGNHEWGHNDKQCAIKENYWLECETCMAIEEYSFCPQCGLKATRLESDTHAVCYVCRDCEYFFYASY